MITENVDNTEIEKFKKLAKEWWDLEGPCRTLHAINPPRLQFIADHCVLSNQRILDVGCGGGILSESLALRGAKVTGIDPNPAVIEVAKSHALSTNIKNLSYEIATPEDFAKDHANSFDIVTCMELLEHVPNPLSLIQACAQLVKPGGALFFSTLNRTLKSYCLAILGAEYILKLLPRKTHDYEKFIRPSELNPMLKKSNLILKKITGLYYNPITKMAKLTPDVSVNYLIYAKS